MRLCKRHQSFSSVPGSFTDGGARRDRTDDLLLAKQALSQLSYGPTDAGTFSRSPRLGLWQQVSIRDLPRPCQGKMVGLGRLELPTSRLSGVRSNHLSYRPDDA